MHLLKDEKKVNLKECVYLKCQPEMDGKSDREDERVACLSTCENFCGWVQIHMVDSLASSMRTESGQTRRVEVKTPS